MLLNLRQLGTGHAYDGKTLDFDHILDLSAVKLWGGYPFSKPVSVSGAVTYRSGIFTVRYLANFEMQGVCSRCLTPIKRDYKREFEHIVPAGFEDENDGYGSVSSRGTEPARGESFHDNELAPDGELDLDELVTSDLLLEFSGIMLCGESCRGLCPKCGKNLNEGGCGCDLSEPDPRFQVLRDFLNDNE